jgi:SAM-dependent methyltransferase
VGRREVEDAWEKDSYQYEALLPAGLIGGPGTVGLDVGCGGGADLLRTARAGGVVVGFDLSAGVDVAAGLTRDFPNVDLVQGDINRAPFRREAFDFIYSFGVLHHLPDPAAGMRRLATLLKPGAPLVTYLYEDFGDRSALERGLIAAVRGVRRVTSRLPPRTLYAACLAATPLIWLTCSVPARALAKTGVAVAERIPFRHTVRWPVLASDLFDRFAPPVEWRFSRAGVLALYDDAGLEGVEVRRHRGWVSWGFKPAGRSDPGGTRAPREQASRLSH